MPILSFRSKITREILQFFFLHKEARPYVRDLSRKLALDPSNVSKKLRELEERTILLSENDGTKRYFLNKKNPLVRDLEHLFSASYGFPSILRKKIEALQGISRVFLFGSYATGALSSESDIDILLIGSHSPRKAKEIILPLQRIAGRELNIVDITEEELEKKIKEKDPFFTRIFSRKMICIL